MKKIYRVLLASLLFTAVGAKADTDVSLPILAGGINRADFATCKTLRTACEKQYDGGAQINAQIACIKTLYVDQSVCAQTQALEAQTGVLPELASIRTVGSVTWFYVSHRGDGIDNYYLLDSAGRLLSLATSQNPLLAQAPNYLKFMQPYPDGALQSIVTTKTSDTPSIIRKQPDDSVQFVFKQFLKKTDCVACAIAGSAEVVYYFDHRGHYQGVQLTAIEPSNLD